MMETPIATQQAAWPSLVVGGCGDLIDFQERPGCGFLFLLKLSSYRTSNITLDTTPRVTGKPWSVHARCCVQGIEIMLGYPASAELQPRIISSVGAP